MLEKTLESPLDCKEIQPVHLKETSLGCSLEGLMLKLKLQYFGHLMRRAESLEKSLILGGIGSRRRRGQQLTGLRKEFYLLKELHGGIRRRKIDLYG